MMRKKMNNLIRFLFLALLPLFILKPVLVYTANGQTNVRVQGAGNSFAHYFQVYSFQETLRHVQKVVPELPALIPGITKAKAPSLSDSRLKPVCVYSHFLPESFLILRI